MANFREEDEELQSIIEAHLANFESFKISTEKPKEETQLLSENDLSAMGSETRAATVETDLGTTTNDVEVNTTETPLNVEENELVKITDEKVEEISSTIKPEMTEVLEVKAEKSLEDLEILKNIAKEFLKRKYKRVKKPKNLQNIN